MRILVADDNRDDARLIADWLTHEGHVVTHVRDGEAALAHLRRACPDLLLSDILMPRLDGFALCRAVKDDPQWRHIFFVFCTATYTDERDSALALRLGAQRFLTKPVDFDRLRTVLAEAQAGSAQASVPSPDAALPEPAYLQMYNERLVSKLEENHRHLQSAAAVLRRQNEKLWALSEAGRVLGEAVGVGDVEQILVQRALELSEAETALLFDVDGEDVNLRRAAGRFGGLLQGLVVAAPGGICARLAAGGDAVSLNPAAGKELAAELLLPDAPGSAMLAPAPGRDSGKGQLAVLHSRPGQFDSAALQFFRLLAHHGAVALENARLVEALRAQADALRRSQDQLIHNARMAPVGRLTAALAHEINNPLQSILGSLQFALEQLPASQPHREYLELAAAELDRVADIVRRMVGFYRRDDDERIPTDLNALLRDTMALAEKQLQRHRVAVVAALDDSLPRVPIAPNQFKQVFLNLILNAADAMAQGGHLQISTRRDGADRVEIYFADSGPGIPPQELERIFESFYTTKPHGTGLGLSVSRDIVARHRGQLLAESEPGRGAIFRVLLPLSTSSQ